MCLSDIEVAVAAADAGAAVVSARFRTSLRRFEKTAMDFATDADVDAEQAILAVLRAERPADGYHGEELGASGSRSADRTWLVDPLCGTLNFAAQTPMVAVNVALRHGDRIEAAACADPLTDGQLRDSVHFAAGIALCQAAGCMVTGLRGQPLHTGPGGLLAAADRQTHAALLEIIELQARGQHR